MELNKIYCGNCMELIKDIPNDSVDCIITDPPYKLIEGGGGFLPSDIQWNKNGMFEQNEIEFKQFMPLFLKILRSNAYSFIMTNDTRLPELLISAKNVGLKYCGLLIMGKSTVVRTSYFGKNFELCTMFRKGSYAQPNIWCTKSLEIYRIKKRYHPTEKPIKFISKIIRTWTSENDTILDPFIGGGTTAIACRLLNRNFIGFEINPDYVTIANKRLQQNTLHSHLTLADYDTGEGENPQATSNEMVA